MCTCFLRQVVTYIINTPYSRCFVKYQLIFPSTKQNINKGRIYQGRNIDLLGGKESLCLI